MTQAPNLQAAAIQLADTLAAENAALRALDLPGAAALLVQKQAALAAFAAARTCGRPAPALLPTAIRLRELAEENRRLLERAITVQTRVLGVLAGAARSVNVAPRYGRSGAYAARPAGGWALRANA
jgi:hypothetical protein